MSLTFRFANLSNNTCLELKRLLAPRTQTNVSVAVQSESGQRTTGLFMPNTSLYQVIAETSGLPAAKKGQQVVCLFTRKEIVGEENLKTTTLKSLGLTSGSVVLRILVRDESVLGGQAFVEDLRLKKDAGKTKTAEKVVADVKQNVTKSFKSLKKMVSSAFESSDKPDESSNAGKKTTTDVGGRRLGSAADQPSSSESSLASTSTKNTQPSPAVESKASTSKEKQHESKSGTSRQISQEITTQSSGQINFLGEREALVFKQSDIPKMRSLPDSDEFFEVTKEDVMIMYQDLKDQIRQMQERPLETSQLRARKDAQQAKKYSKTVLRICFPHDGLFIQANFSPEESIADVAQFIRQFLVDSKMDFYLFTTPPKVVLENKQTLHSQKLVPAAIIHFGDNTQSKVLKQELNSKVTPFDAIIKATSELRAQIAQSAISVEGQNAQADTSSTSVARQVTATATDDNNTDSLNSSGPKVQTSDQKVPKWFKMGK